MLDKLREEIDVIDGDIAQLLTKRFALVEKIAEVKKAEGIATLDKERERQLFARIESSVPQQFAGYVSKVFVQITQQSKDYQRSLSVK